MIEGSGTSFIELFFVILGVGLYLFIAFGFWTATSRVCTLVSHEHSKNPILIVTSLFWPITLVVLIFIAFVAKGKMKLKENSHKSPNTK